MSVRILRRGRALRRLSDAQAASRFLAKFERCRKNIEEEERVLSLFEHEPTRSVTQYRGLDTSHCAVLQLLAPTKNEVSDRLFSHYRLFEKLCSVLGAAIRRIPQKHLRDYLIWHYFYQFTHEVIAEVMNYSVRQIYRQGAQARSALNAALRLPPQPKRTQGHRYRVTLSAREALCRKKAG